MLQKKIVHVFFLKVSRENNWNEIHQNTSNFKKQERKIISVSMIILTWMFKIKRQIGDAGVPRWLTYPVHLRSRVHTCAQEHLSNSFETSKKSGRHFKNLSGIIHTPSPAKHGSDFKVNTNTAHNCSCGETPVTLTHWFSQIPSMQGSGWCRGASWNKYPPGSEQSGQRARTVSVV